MPDEYSSGTTSFQGAVINGKVVGDTSISAKAVGVGFPNYFIAKFRKIIRIPLAASAFPANTILPRVDSVRVQIEIPPQQLQVLALRRDSAIVPFDSVVQRGNNVVYFATITPSSSSLDVRSVATAPTVATVRIVPIRAYPNFAVQATTSTLTLEQTRLSFALAAPRTLQFGKAVDAPISLNEASQQSSFQDTLVGVTSLRTTFTLDTSLIEVPTFWSASKKPLTPVEINSLGRNNLRITVDVPIEVPHSTTIASMRLRSKSFVNANITTSLALDVQQPPQSGYRFDGLPAQITLEPVIGQNALPVGDEIIQKAKRGEHSLLFLAPNPVADVASIRLLMAEQSDVHISILNSVGSVVAEKNIKNVEQGVAEIALPVQELARGAYIVWVRMNKQHETRRLMILR